MNEWIFIEEKKYDKLWTNEWKWRSNKVRNVERWIKNYGKSELNEKRLLWIFLMFQTNFSAFCRESHFVSSVVQLLVNFQFKWEMRESFVVVVLHLHCNTFIIFFSFSIQMKRENHETSRLNVSVVKCTDPLWPFKFQIHQEYSLRTKSNSDRCNSSISMRHKKSDEIELSN